MDKVRRFSPVMIVLVLAVLAAGIHPAAASHKPGPALQETASPETQTRSVSGQVLNGSNPEESMEGLEVTLHAFNEEGQVLTLNTAVDSSGAFHFPDVVLNPGLIFLVSGSCDSIRYSSLPAQAAEGDTELFFQLIVYESSDNIGSLSISRMHIAFDFLDENAIRIGELWVLHNASDFTVSSPAGLEVLLPDGFSGLEVDPSIEPMITVTASGFVFDQAFLPGEDAGSLMFSYSLPYRRSLQFSRAFPLPLQGGTLMLPANGLSLRGSRISTSEMINVSQTGVQTWTFPALQAGETLDLQISGAPPGTALLLPSSRESLTGGVLLLILSGGFFWFSQRNLSHKSQPAAETGSYKKVIQQIAELDEQLNRQTVSPHEYRQRRIGLKTKAMKLYEEKHDLG